VIYLYSEHFYERWGKNSYLSLYLIIGNVSFVLVEDDVHLP